MEARDSGSKIRPLPIDDIDGSVPQHQPIEPRRRIAPLVVIVAGAIAFGFIARGLGVGDLTEVGAGTTTAPPATLAEEPTTTLPSPPPPKDLREMLPMAANGINLVALTPSSARIGQWEPDLSFPTYNASITQPTAAEYNSDGTKVAIRTGVKEGSFVIDDSVGGGPTYIDGTVTGGAWHPTDPSLFAWSDSDDSTATTIIRVADLSADTSAGIAALSEFTLQGSHALEAWGDWGFVTSSGEMTFGFDPDGLETRSADGAFYDNSVDGTLLLAEMGSGGPAPFLLNDDGSLTDLPNLDIGASDFRITHAGDWVLAVTIQEDGHTSILARTVHSRSTRLTSIDEAAQIVAMAWKDRFLVLQGSESNDLVFKDWNTGAEFAVPLDDPIGAVFLDAELSLIE